MGSSRTTRTGRAGSIRLGRDGEHLELLVDGVSYSTFHAERPWSGFVWDAIASTILLVGKPDPQVFQLAAERLGLSAGRCVVVEDAVAGIAAAKAAGMKCIGLVSKGHTREELSEVDLLVDSLSELSPSRIHAMLDAVE